MPYTLDYDTTLERLDAEFKDIEITLYLCYSAYELGKQGIFAAEGLHFYQIGTPMYVAPENNTHDLTSHQDWHQLLDNLMTGREPSAGWNVFDHSKEHVERIYRFDELMLPSTMEAERGGTLKRREIFILRMLATLQDRHANPHLPEAQPDGPPWRPEDGAYRSNGFPFVVRKGEFFTLSKHGRFVRYVEGVSLLRDRAVRAVRDHPKVTFEGKDESVFDEDIARRKRTSAKEP